MISNDNLVQPTITMNNKKKSSKGRSDTHTHTKKKEKKEKLCTEDPKKIRSK